MIISKEEKSVCTEKELEGDNMNYSNATKRQLYQIALDNEVRMSDRYAAVRELQDRRGKKEIFDDDRHRS